ncbi:hypothetical protein EMGBS4_04620 [Acidimicrobiaceae bacterium]|nr:hypothetical protein EMGBS4_04620 [Acidimicrobiaceae bacterium]
MKIDLAGPKQRGFAMGLNEAAGYGAVAITALATGYIAEQAGLRPEPFFLGIAYVGLASVFLFLCRRDAPPMPITRASNRAATNDTHKQSLSTKEIFILTSFRDKAFRRVHKLAPRQQSE